MQAASASPMPDGVTDPNYQPPPGRLGNLTMVQLHTLDKFKRELKEEGYFVEERMNDAMLLRCDLHFFSVLDVLKKVSILFFFFLRVGYSVVVFV